MDKLEIAKEAVRIYFEENITADKAIEKITEKYLDTDQSIQGTTLNENIIEDIISHVLTIDKDEVYNKHTGKQ